MTELTLTTLCGALRAGSFNRKLMVEAVRHFEPAHHLDGDLRLPLYDGDLEADGLPGAVTELADRVRMADAVVIAAPEYNQSISGVLKNALDWLSRVKGPVWRDKPLAIMSATAGRAGGARAQYAMRLALNPFRPRLLPGPELLVAHAAEQFDDDGRLTNDLYIDALSELMDELRGAVAR